MKIFPKRNRIVDFQELVQITQAKVEAVVNAPPQELVAVKSTMGGFELHRQDVPLGREYVLVR